MAKIKMYFHTGSSNHGCEAIVRSTKKILNEELDLFSFAPEEEDKYGIDNIVNVYKDDDLQINRYSLKYLISAIQIKLLKKTTLNTKFRHNNFFKKVKKGDVCLSIGGDNYCYPSIDMLQDYNSILNAKGAKTVLWGCSLDEGIAESIKEDLDKYSLIVVRESLSYQSIKEAGVTTNVELCPDPAFLLDKDAVQFPNGFNINNLVGINVSPVILTFANADLIIKNYESLIEYLLNTTDSNIVLLPHMLKEKSSDRKVLLLFYEKYKDTGRVIILDDNNAQQMKGYISQCRFFIGARTHSVIAAYSLSIPTLAVSYSMKAKGIAKDIFGTYQNYVSPVQNFTSDDELVKAFKWIEANEQNILNHYKKVMPDYKASAQKGEMYLKKILKNEL